MQTVRDEELTHVYMYKAFACDGDDFNYVAFMSRKQTGGVVTCLACLAAITWMERAWWA